MGTTLLLTGFYAGILTFLYIALSFKVINLRRKHSVGIGDGENSELAKAIRVHSNFAEYIPLTLVLFAIYEINHGSMQILHGLGGFLVICRFLHAFGLARSKGTTWQRFIGAAGTFGVMLVLAVINIAWLAGF
ncbi:MAPEG family protein [Thalassotalea sp. ND16A]|uniref:MAPEG family protein n=1 Tax=Thalassotalea sp. ND16A TaxID=1535422 RepID=UPI00051A2D2F|nr:MAPEG family protein [Thalassotalea sp. ND16A]KGJ87497.1 hypothetical protein ND16A_2880 [Thalassotalea sp. ND16A]